MWKNSNSKIPPSWRTTNVNKTERLSVMAKASDYFLSLDDKSKQRCKVKTINMQGYDPYQIKKEELSGDITKFPRMQ